MAARVGMRDAMGKLLVAASMLAVCQIVHGHGHSHSHSHGHDADHGHSHAHSHGGASDDDATYGWLSKFCREWPQVSALIATAFISTSSLFVMPLLPLIDTEQKKKGAFSSEEAMRSDAVLKLMVSFAVGGLLGDVFLHLIPHAAASLCHMQSSPLGDANVLGFPLLLGMFCFFIMEKTLNSISGGGGHGHAHGAAEPKTPTPRKKSKGRDDKRSQSPARQRKRKNSTSSGASGMGSEWDQVKPAAYLNWVADAMHNFCDGLALAVTFAAGSGIPTTLAVFFHEVPHNLADFAILIQNGVSKRNALLAQFASALGAAAGCLVGLSLPDQPWLHCFVGGGFIYIATVGILPTLVQSGSVKETLAQSLAMLFGVLMMVLVLFLEGH